ncbi:MAG: glycosyltransferase family 2 protein [Eubacteriales bacterium]|jgi:GT2 family glycosyltransferase
MKELYYHVDEHRIAGSGQVYYRVTGWKFSRSGREVSVRVTDQNDAEIPFEIRSKMRTDVARSHRKAFPELGPEIGFEIRVSHPEDLADDHRQIVVHFVCGAESRVVCRDDPGLMLKMMNLSKPYTRVENWVVRDESVWINGWAFSRGGNCTVRVTDMSGNGLPADIDRSRRIDLCNLEGLPFDSKPGFQIRISRGVVKGDKLQLHFETDGGQKTQVINVTPGARRNKNLYAFAKKVIRYAGSNGIKGLITRAVRGPERPETINYDAWFRTVRASDAALEEERKQHFPQEPKISICIPLYNTRPAFLRDIVNSVRDQSYANWELCLADGSTDEEPGNIIRGEYGGDPRIIYRKLEKNEGISGNTNEALKMASGDFLLLADHDDMLERDALFEIVRKLNEDPEYDIVYTDEDVMTEDGKRFHDPHFKPDYSPDYLLSINYITHIFCVRRSVAMKTGGFRRDCEGAQDWDMILHCCEYARKVAHIPKVLYHWRASGGSTAQNPDSKMYAVESGKRAVSEHMSRVGLDGELEYTLDFICFHPILHVKGEPKVSIIICSRDHTDLLRACIDSILGESTYGNYEIVVVENGSTEQQTFDYYREICSRDPRVRVVTYEEKGPFNYSKVNNFGAEQADGEYLILLNNDTKVISKDWIEGMLGYCQRDDVGAVGAKLYYEDQTVQHNGVVIGMGGFAGHVLTGLPANDGGYLMLNHATHDVSAVTAACMMTKRSVWDEVGGLTEDFRLALNDVDFCLKVRATGRLVVQNNAVELYHLESKSRGYEDTPERHERFKNEIRLFRSRWKRILDEGDPYYNPNLSLMYNDYRIREPGEHFDIIDEIEAEDRESTSEDID